MREHEGWEREPVHGRRLPEPMEQPTDWARRELGFSADEKQAEALNSRSKRVLLNCSRQWGKSTVTAAKAMYHAQHTPGSLILAVSPSARQSGEFLRKVTGFARKLGIRPKGDGDNEMSLALPNESRIIGLPGSEETIRGFSAVSLLLVDEASRVSDDLYMAVRPMLAASGGALWLMSTPNGKRGFFYEAWEHGGTGWKRIRAPATECPRIPAAFLEEERATMGERRFGQEYLCEFGEAVDGVFDLSLVSDAISSEIKPLKF